MRNETILVIVVILEAAVLIGLGARMIWRYFKEEEILNVVESNYAKLGRADDIQATKYNILRSLIGARCQPEELKRGFSLPDLDKKASKETRRRIRESLDELAKGSIFVDRALDHGSKITLLLDQERLTLSNFDVSEDQFDRWIAKSFVKEFTSLLKAEGNSGNLGDEIKSLWQKMPTTIQFRCMQKLPTKGSGVEEFIAVLSDFAEGDNAVTTDREKVSEHCNAGA